MSFDSLLIRTCTIKRMYDTGEINDIGEYKRELRVVARDVRCTYEESGIPTIFEGETPTDYSKTRYTFFMPFGTNVQDGDYILLHNEDQEFDESSYSSSSSSSTSSSSSSTSQEFDSWSSSSSNSSSSSSTSQEYNSWSSSSSSSSSSNSSSSTSSNSSSTSREPYPWSSSSSSQSSSSSSSSQSSSSSSLSSSSSSAIVYTVVGAGNGQYNGDYLFFLDNGGNDVYKHISDTLYIFTNGSAWYIGDDYNNAPGAVYDELSLPVSATPPLTGWISGIGDLPAPTISI